MRVDATREPDQKIAIQATVSEYELIQTIESEAFLRAVCNNMGVRFAQSLKELIGPAIRDAFDKPPTITPPTGVTHAANKDVEVRRTQGRSLLRRLAAKIVWFLRSEGRDSFRHETPETVHRV